MAFGGSYEGSAWKEDGRVRYKTKFDGYADRAEVEMKLAESLPEASSRATQRCIDAVDEYVKKIWLGD